MQATGKTGPPSWWMRFRGLFTPVARGLAEGQIHWLNQGLVKANPPSPEVENSIRIHELTQPTRFSVLNEVFALYEHINIIGSEN